MALGLPRLVPWSSSRCRWSSRGADARRPSARRRPARGLVPAAAGAAAGVTALTWAAQRPARSARASRRRARGAGAVPAPAAAAGVFRVRRRAGGRGRPRPARGRVLHRQLLRPADADGHARLVTDRRRVPLVTASLGWTTLLAWQGRHPAVPRAALLRTGFCLVAAGTVGLLPSRPGGPRAGSPRPPWTLAGLGMAWASRRCRSCCGTRPRARSGDMRGRAARRRAHHRRPRRRGRRLLALLATPARPRHAARAARGAGRAGRTARAAGGLSPPAPATPRRAAPAS